MTFGMLVQNRFPFPHPISRKKVRNFNKDNDVISCSSSGLTAAVTSSLTSGRVTQIAQPMLTTHLKIQSGSKPPFRKPLIIILTNKTVNIV